MLIILLIAFSATAIFSICVCITALLLIKTSSGNEKSFHVKQGLRLIVHSGLVLACLWGVVEAIEIPTPEEKMCGAFFEMGNIEKYYEYSCEPSLAHSTIEELFISVLKAISWFIPLAFAATGVNVLSHGLLLDREQKERNLEALARSLNWPLNKLFSKFIGILK